MQVLPSGQGVGGRGVQLGALRRRLQRLVWAAVLPLFVLSSVADIDTSGEERHLESCVSCLIRHQGAADALATVEPLLALWLSVRAQGGGRFARVADSVQSEHFMPGWQSSR